MILNILKTSYYSEAMSVATWIICNLLLKAQNMPVFCCWYFGSFWNIKKAEWLFFSHWIFAESLFQWSVSTSDTCLRLIFWGCTKIRIARLNLLHLQHWCFRGKSSNFSEAASGSVRWRKLFLKNLLYSQESCRPATLLKRDSNKDVFLWIPWNF